MLAKIVSLLLISLLSTWPAWAEPGDHSANPKPPEAISQDQTSSPQVKVAKRFWGSLLHDTETNLY